MKKILNKNINLDEYLIKKYNQLNINQILDWIKSFFSELDTNILNKEIDIFLKEFNDFIKNNSLKKKYEEKYLVKSKISEPKMNNLYKSFRCAFKVINDKKYGLLSMKYILKYIQYETKSVDITLSARLLQIQLIEKY